MDADARIRDIENERERRRAARALIGEYHDAELRKLLDHVRDGFRRLDAGEIDPVDLGSLTIILRPDRSTDRADGIRMRAASASRDVSDSRRYS